MNRYTPLTKKTCQIITAEEALFKFPLMKEAIQETPPGYVWLMITDERPASLKVPPQLVGALPIEEAEKQVREHEEKHLSNIQYILNRLDGPNVCDGDFKFKGDDEDDKG